TTTSINHDKAIKIKSQASKNDGKTFWHETSNFHEKMMYIKTSAGHNNIVKQLINAWLFQNSEKTYTSPSVLTPVSPLPLPFCFLTRKQRDLQKYFFRFFFFIDCFLKVC